MIVPSLAVRLGLLVAVQVLGPPPAVAQTEAERSIALSLGEDPSLLLGSAWVPDPSGAPEAIGGGYFADGDGGNMVLSSWGLFSAEGGTYALVGPIDGLYGQDPRDAAFLPDRVEITTTIQGPDDPRCCPTDVARWSIDRASLAAARID